MDTAHIFTSGPVVPGIVDKSVSNRIASALPPQLPVCSHFFSCDFTYFFSFRQVLTSEASPVSIQTQSRALRAFRKRKPQETSSQSWLPTQAIAFEWKPDVMQIVNERHSQCYVYMDSGLICIMHITFVCVLPRYEQALLICKKNSLSR